MTNADEERISAVALAAARSMSSKQFETLLEKSKVLFPETPGLNMVLFWNGEYTGATNRPHPLGWRPGCVAIDKEGNAFVAAGGNYIDGADRWDPIPRPPSV